MSNTAPKRSISLNFLLQMKKLVNVISCECGHHWIRKWELGRLTSDAGSDDCLADRLGHSWSLSAKHRRSSTVCDFLYSVTSVICIRRIVSMTRCWSAWRSHGSDCVFWTALLAVPSTPYMSSSALTRAWNAGSVGNERITHGTVTAVVVLKSVFFCLGDKSVYAQC